MIYSLYLVLIICNCLAFQNILPLPINFFVSFVFFLLIFIKSRKKNSVIASLVILMCLSIPLSFRNVMGGDFDQFPLSWFYFFGFILSIVLLFKWLKTIEDIRINYYQLIILFTILFSIIPLINSTFFREGLNEFITLIFFLVLLLTSSLMPGILRENEYKSAIGYYIAGTLLSSLMVTLQYILFQYGNIPFLKVTEYGGGRLYFSFLFADMSVGTLYMASGIVLIFFNIPAFINKLNLSLIILLGMALSSARAGFVTLLLTLMLYSISSKNFKKFFFFSTIAAFIGYFSITLMSNVRSYDSNIEYLVSNTGRIEGYIDGFKYFINSPIIGTGYDLGARMKSVGLVVPHFALINLLAQGGFFFTFLLIILLMRVLHLSKHQHYIDLYWTLVLSFLGSCIIPGFFSARFFIVLVILVFLRERIVKL